MNSLAPGARVGPYTIVRALASGGMGVVYEAVQDHPQRRTALKVVSPWLVSESGRKRFELEARACAQLHHPNTVHIYDFGESEDGLLYCAMEYLDGFDLGELVERDGMQSRGRTVRILSQIAGALGEAHDNGLIHRDIKPANILLCEIGGVPDLAKLVDFGLVMPVSQESSDPSRRNRRVSLDGERVLGTPRYVAPEMLEDGAVGPPADFYALGLVAHYMLTGKHAMDGEDTLIILRRQKENEAPDIRMIRPDVSPELAKILTWLGQKDPAARPANARQLIKALAKCPDKADWKEDEAREWWTRWRAWRDSNRPSG